MSATCHDRCGFTLIELLMTMAVLALIAAMILAVAGPMREGQRASRTRAILAIVQQGLAVSQQEHGGSLPMPAEHPFAGSKAPRLRFRGMRASSWRDLETDGEALCGVVEARLDLATDTTAHLRLLAPTDLCSEPDLPAFYGLRRSAMGIIGAPLAHLTRRLDLAPASGSGIIPAPYRPYDAWTNPYDVSFQTPARVAPYTTADLPHYPDMATGNPALPRDRFLIEGVIRTIETVPIPPGGTKPYYQAHGENGWRYRAMSCTLNGLPAQAAALEYAIPDGLLDELRSLKALSTPPDDSSLTVAGPSIPTVQQWAPAERKLWLETRTQSANTQVVQVAGVATMQRVWTDGQQRDTWEKGRIRPALDGSGRWVTYRLRGPALYDAWGTEILYAIEDGVAVVQSAGRDRCFALVPGLADANGTSIFATDLNAGLDAGPTAPDRDGMTDNIRLPERR